MSLTLIIVAVTCVISFIAFTNGRLLEGLLFWPYRVWHNKEWYRLFSGGFIHAGMNHLLFNMIALFSFGEFVEKGFYEIFGTAGPPLYITMYFLAIATSDTFNLFKRKDDYNYRSLGASGGVSAVIFASVLLNPYGSISIFFLPGIPAFIFGPLYLGYCVYMAKRGNDNIGHIAHFTGAIIGFVFPIIFRPELLTDFITLLTNGR